MSCSKEVRIINVGGGDCDCPVAIANIQCFTTLSSEILAGSLNNDLTSEVTLSRAGFSYQNNTDRTIPLDSFVTLANTNGDEAILTLNISVLDAAGETSTPATVPPISFTSNGFELLTLSFPNALSLLPGDTISLAISNQSLITASIRRVGGTGTNAELSSDSVGQIRERTVDRYDVFTRTDGTIFAKDVSNGFIQELGTEIPRDWTDCNIQL